MPTQWTCVCVDCPPTDIAPARVTAMGDEVAMAVCGGECGKEHHWATFRIA